MMTRRVLEEVTLELHWALAYARVVNKPRIFVSRIVSSACCFVFPLSLSKCLSQPSNFLMAFATSRVIPLPAPCSSELRCPAIAAQ